MTLKMEALSLSETSVSICQSPGLKSHTNLPQHRRENLKSPVLTVIKNRLYFLFLQFLWKKMATLSTSGGMAHGFNYRSIQLPCWIYECVYVYVNSVWGTEEVFIWRSYQLQYIHGVQELRSILRDLIPELMRSQKYHIHMGTIRNGPELKSF